jgi:predicted nucleic acid-binding protein
VAEVTHTSDDSVEVLDAGEQAALDLASEMHADIVLSDDSHARQAASRRGFAVMGTVGILGKAREMGLLKATYPLLLELRRNGQWLSDDLLQLVRSQETHP